MRGIRKLLLLASIPIASASVSLAAQSSIQMGDKPATTDLTPSQRAFAQAYLTAVTGQDIERYKVLLDPTTRACMNNDNADFFATIFTRRIGKVASKPVLSVETLPSKFTMFDAMNAHGYIYDVRPTHAFHIDLVPRGDNQSFIIAFARLDKGTWYEVLPCPNAEAVAQLRVSQQKNDADMAKAGELAKSMHDPLRAEILALLKDHKPVSAAKRYAEATKVDLTLASRVVDALEKDKH